MARPLHGSLAALAALALLPACSAVPLPEGGNRIDAGSTLAFGLPVNSLLERRFERVIRQQYDFSCGSAALATLLRYHYNDPQTETSVFIGMFREGDRAQIRRAGFSLLDMKRYLAGRGISADGYKVTLDQIAKARVPGIALVDFSGYKHFVVLIGLDSGTVLLADPSLGLRRENIPTFLKQWNGVLFVLNGRLQIAQSHFNQPADLVLAPGYPIYPEAEPLSVAALALFRPGPNEL